MSDIDRALAASLFAQGYKGEALRRTWREAGNRVQWKAPRR